MNSSTMMRLLGALSAVMLLGACSGDVSTASGAVTETSGGEEGDGIAKAVPVEEEEVTHRSRSPIDQPIPQAEPVAVESGPPKLDPKAASIWGAPDAESGKPLPKRTPMKSGAQSAHTRALAASDQPKQKAAAAAFQKALSADPKAYEAAFNLGVMADRAGQEKRALEYYKRALKIQPDYEKAVQGVVRVHVRNGSPDQAVSFVQPIAKRWERNLYLQAVLSEALTEADRVDEAEKAARRALRRDERFVPAMVALARASLKRGRNELAESILTQALVIDPSNPEIHFLQGLALRESGRLAPAMQKFSKAVELRPDYAEAHMALGRQYMVGGNYGKAQGEFEAVVRLAPMMVAAHLNLGDAYRANKHWQAAKRELDKALRMDSTLAAAHFNLGLMYMVAKADFPKLDNMGALKLAILEFNNYRQKMGAKLRKDDPSGAYMVDLERSVEREVKRIARAKKQAEREARKKAMEKEKGK